MPALKKDLVAINLHFLLYKNCANEEEDMFFWQIFICTFLHKRDVKFDLVENVILVERSSYKTLISVISNLNYLYHQGAMNDVKRQMHILYKLLLSANSAENIDKIIKQAKQIKTNAKDDDAFCFDLEYFKELCSYNLLQKCRLEQKKQIIRNLFFNNKYLIQAICELNKCHEKLKYKISYEETAEKDKFSYQLIIED